MMAGEIGLNPEAFFGGGEVYPELNFTLPTMFVNEETMDAVGHQYRQMITGALRRAAELQPPGVMVEFETLPPMTENPQWGIDLAKILLEVMQQYHETTGLKMVLRMTPNDTREMVRPPVMRSGELWDAMLKTFDGSAAAGAELLSIESVGGKEVHDEALQMCDLPQVIFSLCIMGARDMRFLWSHIAEIATRHGVHAAGDTACGFANTAMVLAEQKMIPRVFAAVDRAVSAVRSLVAYECGAVGPGKDCGYENPILKAITGRPMAMEGKTSACAHLTKLGNIAGATCDTWSNESVPNVRLLADFAPTCSMEQLIFDTRLMNQAAASGPEGVRMLRDWMVNSDARHEPQAYILTPASAIRIGQTIVDAESHYLAGKAAARTAIDLMERGMNAGELDIPEREQPWLGMMRDSLDTMPDDENAFIEQVMPTLDTSKFVAADYELAPAQPA